VPGRLTVADWFLVGAVGVKVRVVSLLLVHFSEQKRRDGEARVCSCEPLCVSLYPVIV
jgi:hypothetical protein